jgi:hypothetical protein
MISTQNIDNTFFVLEVVNELSGQMLYVLGGHVYFEMDNEDNLYWHRDRAAKVQLLQVRPRLRRKKWIYKTN